MNPQLNDLQWRDANLETLDRWYPVLRDCGSDLVSLDAAINEFVERYRDILLGGTSEPETDLKAHCIEELTVHIAHRLERAIEAVWGQLPGHMD